MARVKLITRISSIMAATGETTPNYMTDSESSTSEDEHSTSTDEFSERCCPICLDIMKDQKVGKVMYCGHLFCASCIIEWLNRKSICPLDRCKPRSLLVFKNMELVNWIQCCESVTLYHVNCIVCHLLIRNDELATCGSCKADFHVDCITPPVKTVKPHNNYTCPRCMQIPIHRRSCKCWRCRKAAESKQGRRNSQGGSTQHKLQHGQRSIRAARSPV